MSVLLSTLGFALGATCMLAAELRLPAFLSDHMVLQRESRAPILGWAEPNERVTLRPSWGGAQALEVRADAEGRFRAELPTPAAGGPHRITIQAESGATLVIDDVLIGEVWLASGQSNMEWTLGPGVGNGVAGWRDAVALADDPDLRFFDVANEIAPAARDDLRGKWRVATRESASTFSATAYFFARKLREELDVPVGVISADWGGTPAEAWMSAGALAAFPEFEAPLAYVRDAASDPLGPAHAWESLLAAWWSELAAKDPGSDPASGWMRVDVAPDGFEPLDLPSSWEQHGLAEFDGIAWYRRDVELPEDWGGRGVWVELGPIDDCDTVWWNGERIGGLEREGAWPTPRRYAVAPGLARAGRNVLAVRVLDTRGNGGFMGGAAGMRAVREDDGERLPLGGRWRWRQGAALSAIGRPPPDPLSDPNAPSVLSNAMIAPLEGQALRGVIWYQGESNRERAEQYRALFPALIRDWRARFERPELPFYFVQIAPYAYPGDTGEAARLRDAQREALALPHTGMAVTMDVGDPADIHPSKKQEVGERLALWALARDYGRADLECSGPLYRSMKIEGDAIRVEFEHASGLTSRGAAVRHVTLAGADRVFHPAEVRIDGETLVVTSPAVAAPLAVRFGWGAADGTELWNGAGLPAASFRTDDWP